MNFGIVVEFRPNTPVADQFDEWSELVDTAGAGGFNSVWVPESYGVSISPNPPASLIALASLRHAARGMRIGTAVTLLPAYHPLRLAYEASLLDQLSRGRFVLGLGVGRPELARRFGMRADVGVWVDDAIKALRALWGGADGYEGQALSLSGRIGPLPYSEGGPPIWVGGYLARSARRAAWLGDGYILGTATTFAVLTQQIARYRRFLKIAGKSSPATVAVNRLTVVADSEFDATQIARTNAGTVLARYAQMGSIRATTIDAHATPAQIFDRFDDEVCLVGTPVIVSDRIERLRAVGVTDIQMRIRPALTSFEDAQATIKLMSTEVIPRFHKHRPDERKS